MKYVITVFFSCLFLVGITQLRTSEEVFLVPQKYISRDASLDNQPALEITVVDDADWFLKYVKNAWKDTKGLSMSRTKTGWASDPLYSIPFLQRKFSFYLIQKRKVERNYYLFS
jgi:hypothetical protein